MTNPLRNISLDSENNLVVPSGSESAQIVFNVGHISWILTSAALVWIMVPGIGFIYAGLLRRKNTLSMVYLSFVATAVTTLQWLFWGYSLAFSDTASSVIGDLRFFGLQHVLTQPFGQIPLLVHCVYQLMFCSVTAILAIGALAERGRLGPAPIFIAVWTTVVYCPIACWNWNPNGWAAVLGTLDWAGGTPVHITSGATALAISAYLGKRKDYGTPRLRYAPSSNVLVALGTVLLWFGWFGFNGGSSLAADMSGTQAFFNTHIAACAGGMTWILWERMKRSPWSVVGFCSGAIAGLVAITPGAGYVSLPAALLFGVVAGIACNLASGIKQLLGIDDCLDIFAVHGVGGLVGNILTGMFAQGTIQALRGPLNGTAPAQGWLDHHYAQMGYQLAASIAGMSWAFCVTTIILWVMHLIPGLRLRAPLRAEILGIDKAYCEYAYDYVEAEPEPGYDLEHELDEATQVLTGHEMHGVREVYDGSQPVVSPAFGGPIVMPHGHGHAQRVGTPYSHEFPMASSPSKSGGAPGEGIGRA